MANPTLKINVTLTRFQVLATATPRFCAATTTVVASGVGQNHPTVTNRAQVKGKKKKIDLEFTIVNGIAGSTDIFWPAGIAFRGASGNVDPTGNYFSDATCDHEKVTVTDDTTLSGPGAGAPVWEAYITVVRLRDLAVGVIDPGVENSDDAVMRR